VVDFTEISPEGKAEPPKVRKPKASAVVPAPKTPQVLPPVKNPLDIVPYQAEIMAYKDFVAKVDHECKTIDIKTDEQKVYAAALGGEIVKTLKAIEARRKEILKASQDFERQINGIVKIITEPLKRSDDLLRWKEKQYNQFLENQRKELERKQQELARDLEAKIKEDAIKRGVSDADVAQIHVPVMLPKEETVTRAETGSSSYGIKTWKIEITNEADVPREYCTPDMKKINQAVKNNGVREITGVSIKEETDIRRRTA
jgi:DNA-binding transcriptional MerR regulator